MTYSIISSRRSFLFSGLICVMLLASSAKAQAPTASSATLSGVVKDPTAAVVPGAEVKLTDKATNASRLHVTDEAGQYVFTGLAPGVYDVEVSLPGFRTAVVSDFKVDVAKGYTLDFSLVIGERTDVVQVETTATAELQTTDATVGNVFIRDQPGAGSTDAPD